MNGTKTDWGKCEGCDIIYDKKVGRARSLCCDSISRRTRRSVFSFKKTRFARQEVVTPRTLNTLPYALQNNVFLYARL